MSVSDGSPSRRGSAAGGNRAKSGKPRPGTGGYGRRKLEGKGPTPPASMRPGHPAQRRAAASAGTSGPAATAGPRDRNARPGDTPAPQRSRAPRGAGEAAEFVAGRNSVVEALRVSVPAVVLYVGTRVARDDRVTESIELAAGRGIPVLEAGAAEMDRLTGSALHQGLALRIRPYEYAHPDDLLALAAEAGETPLIAALDSVTDPRNLGAVVRSAAAFGGHGVVVPSRRGAGVTAGAWKASAGALARLPVARAPNLARTLQNYRDAGVFVAGLDGAGDTPLRDLDLATSPLVLVTGSEGRGLSRIVAEACDVLVRIPITSATESLNAGLATGIALYEVATIRARAT